jgi:hypothetical protein
MCYLLKNSRFIICVLRFCFKLSLKKLKAKEDSIIELFVKEDLNRDSIIFSIQQILYKLESRQRLLEQAVKFHKTAEDVSLYKFYK